MKHLHSLLPRDRRGAIALTFGFVLVPILLGAGSGVDIARGVQVARVLQAAADSAALAGASAYANGDSPPTRARRRTTCRSMPCRCPMERRTRPPPPPAPAPASRAPMARCRATPFPSAQRHKCRRRS